MVIGSGFVPTLSSHPILLGLKFYFESFKVSLDDGPQIFSCEPDGF